MVRRESKLSDILTLLAPLLEEPDALLAELHGYVEKYKPILYGVGNELLGIYTDYANNTDLFAVEAKLRKNQFDAYKAVGFSDEQAIAFIINDNLRLVEQMKKTSTSAAKKKKTDA